MLVYVVEQGVEHVCKEGMVCECIDSEEKSEVNTFYRLTMQSLQSVAIQQSKYRVCHTTVTME